MEIKLTPEEIREIIGDPNQIAADLEEFTRSSQLLNSRETADRYPDEWVAAYRGEVRAHGTTLRAVLEEIDRLGVPREHTAFRYLRRPSTTRVQRITEC